MKKKAKKLIQTQKKPWGNAMEYSNKLFNNVNSAVLTYTFLKAGGHYPKVWMKKRALDYAKKRV